MSTDYTHFDQLAFNKLFARGADGNETTVINSSGTFIGTISGALHVKSISVASNASFTGSITASNFSGTHSGTSSGTNTGNQTIQLTGVVTGSGTGTFATTLANSAVSNVHVAATAAISGSKITSASTAAAGVISTGSQSFAGAKTFLSSVTANSVIVGSAANVVAHVNTLKSTTTLTVTATKLSVNSVSIGSAANTVTHVSSIQGSSTIAVKANATTIATAASTGLLVARNLSIISNALTSNTHSAIYGTTTSASTDLYSSYVGTTLSSSQTNSHQSFASSPTSSGNNSTLAYHIDFTAFGISKGSAGDTIVRQIGLYVPANTTAINNAAISDSVSSFTGNYFIYQTGTRASSLGGSITASNLSGTNTGDQTITLTGAVTGSGTGSFVTTLANNLSVTKTSTDYTILDNDNYRTVLVSTGASNRTITLPLAANNTNRNLLIKKIDSGAGTVTLDGNGSETIDGNTTQLLIQQYDQMEIVCNGTTWYIVNERSAKINAQAYRSTSQQSISSNTDTELVFNASRVDTHSAYSTSTGRFTAPRNGWYQASAGATIAFGATAPTILQIRIYVNGTGDPLGNILYQDIAANHEDTFVTAQPIYLVKNDYISVWAKSSGQTVNLDNTGGTADVSWFKVVGLSE